MKSDRDIRARLCVVSLYTMSSMCTLFSCVRPRVSVTHDRDFEDYPSTLWDPLCFVLRLFDAEYLNSAAWPFVVLSLACSFSVGPIERVGPNFVRSFPHCRTLLRLLSWLYAALTCRLPMWCSSSLAASSAESSPRDHFRRGL